MIRGFNAVAIAVLGTGSLVAGVSRLVEAKPRQQSELTGALSTAARFHAFLAGGDSASAVKLLDSQAMLLESGELETRAEYIAHHLGADIEFARVVASKRTILQARRAGSVAWIVATILSKGTFHDKPIDSSGAELMVLSKSGSEWQIRAIHWSSRKTTHP